MTLPTTVSGLQLRLTPYEYLQPEPLSRIPSQLLRQAVADVRHVAAQGARINMAWYGRINGDCEVCLAGAVLLARGYYSDNAERAVRCNNRDQVTQFFRLDRGIDASNDAISIQCVFNQLRSGNYYSLFEFCNIVVDYAFVTELQDKFSRKYAGSLADNEVDEMCERFEAAAVYLEQKGL